MHHAAYKRIKQDVLQTDVIGMQGQTLGQIEEIVVDVNSGNIAYVMLTTQWSKVQLAWHSMTFDDRDNVFRIRKRGSAKDR